MKKVLQLSLFLSFWKKPCLNGFTRFGQNFLFLNFSWKKTENMTKLSCKGGYQHMHLSPSKLLVNKPFLMLDRFRDNDILILILFFLSILKLWKKGLIKKAHNWEPYSINLTELRHNKHLRFFIGLIPRLEQNAFLFSSILWGLFSTLVWNVLSGYNISIVKKTYKLKSLH